MRAVRLSFFPQSLLQHVGVRRLNSLVIVRLGLHNLETEFFIEIYGALIIDLHMSKSQQQKTVSQINELKIFL